MFRANRRHRQTILPLARSFSCRLRSNGRIVAEKKKRFVQTVVWLLMSVCSVARGERIVKGYQSRPLSRRPIALPFLQRRMVCRTVAGPAQRRSVLETDRGPFGTGRFVRFRQLRL